MSIVCLQNTSQILHGVISINCHIIKICHQTNEPWSEMNLAWKSPCLWPNLLLEKTAQVDLWLLSLLDPCQPVIPLFSSFHLPRYVHPSFLSLQNLGKKMELDVATYERKSISYIQCVYLNSVWKMNLNKQLNMHRIGWYCDSWNDMLYFYFKKRLFLHNFIQKHDVSIQCINNLLIM